MNTNIVIELINNAALLMALSIVYEVSYILPIKWKKSIVIFNGLVIGAIGLAIMTIPFKLATGIVFDTRSILISVTALTFGTIPTVIAACITIAYRIAMGGDGQWMGASVIIISAFIGLIWRRYYLNKISKFRWLNIYLFGITVHIAMLACTFVLGLPTALQVLSKISLPILLIYPIGTVVLSLLLLHQRERNEYLIKMVEAENRYKSIFNNNHAIMLLIDPEDGNIIDANPAACNFYGWSIPTMKSMNISQINTLSHEDINSEMKKAVKKNKINFLFRHRTADNRVIDVEVYSGPIEFNGKSLIYSIVHDISERVATSQELERSEKRFRMLVEGAPDAIFILSDGNFSFANKFAVQLFGAECPEQLIGSPIMDRFHPDFHNLIKDKISLSKQYKEEIASNEGLFLKLNGVPVDVEVTAVPIHYSNRDGTMVFARDITERKKLENLKNEIEAQLRQQQKLEAIGTLAGGVAHEINNPINGIMNYAQLILDEIDRDTEQYEYAKEIIRETERISVIVKNLLQFSRQEKLSHSYGNIYDIINQTMSLIKTIIRKDHIVLEVYLDDNLPDIKCQSQQIQQVIMNLLTNARDALNEKYVDFHENKIVILRCSQYTKEERRWIKIIVEDHGNGISEDIQGKIFEPFFSTKPKDKGTGLGLSISFGIVKDHNGKISIDTKEGYFTKFILELPVDNE